MKNLYTICLALFGVILLGNLVESHDPINNTARLLRELRRLRKHNSHYGGLDGGSSSLGLLGGLSPIRDDNNNNNNNNNYNNQNNNNNNNNNRQSQQSNTNNNAQDNRAQIDSQLANAISQLSQLPTRPPYDLRMVNRGVGTILGGVNQGNLAEILRGSFQFTRNDNVRSVADTVIDSIFGQRG